MMAVTLPLPAGLISAWGAPDGAQNFGLLLQCDTGGLNLRLSQFVSATVPASVRPALNLIFDGGPAWAGYPNATDTGSSPPPPPSDAGNTDARPPAVRKADGSCAVLSGSHFDLDVSSLPVHPNSA
jgi:hypothetical protein